MKQLTLLLIAAMALAGCGGKTPPAEAENKAKPKVATNKPETPEGKLKQSEPKPATVDYSANWHQWRGPLGNGMAPKGDPPVRWSETTNLKWKVAIPGSGSATPIVWGNQIFVVSAIKTDRKPKKIAGQDQPAERPGGRRFGGRMSTPTPTTLYQFVILCLD